VKIAQLKPRLAMMAKIPLGQLVAQRMRGGQAVVRNARFLSDHPYCEHCQGIATEVDHKVPLHLGGIDAEPNLQGLCHDCHAVKTAAEQAARLAPR
jgi:5-methylcytosine-specific restriction protein A